MFKVENVVKGQPQPIEIPISDGLNHSLFIPGSNRLLVYDGTNCVREYDVEGTYLCSNLNQFTILNVYLIIFD